MRRAELARGITGLRSAEDQRAFDNALASIGADTSKRESGTNAAITQAILAMLGMEGEGVPAAGGGNAITDALGVETQKPPTASAGGSKAPSIKNGMDPANAIPVASPPAGATQTSVPGIWYNSTTRKYYEVV